MGRLFTGKFAVKVDDVRIEGYEQTTRELLQLKRQAMELVELLERAQRLASEMAGNKPEPKPERPCWKPRSVW